MTFLALIGGQWGEEGKGKFTELLGDSAKVVVRYSGGGSIRQPVMNQQGRFNLQFIPRSIFNSKAISVLGAGMVIDPRRLVEEIDTLSKTNVNVKRLFISEQAHVVMPYHPVLEEQERKAYGTPIIDTLGSGLGPAYADKITRIGIRVGDLIQEEMFLSRLSKALAVKNDILTRVYKQEPLNLREIYQQYLNYGRQLREHIFDTRHILLKANEEKHRVLLESDQGSMLDLDFGAYPYVSNAAPTVAAAAVSCGIAPHMINGAIGVFGAYVIRAQTGPFPTEMNKEESGPLARFRTFDNGKANRRNNTNPITGENYRRYGWFDAVAAKFVVQLNGLTSLALTYIDGFDNFETIKICTQYQINDAVTSRYTADVATLKIAKPIYEEMPGWKRPTSHITDYKDLPPECQNFIQRIRQLLGVPVDIISTGPNKEDTIFLRDPFNVVNQWQS
jgi:adenylosuccinate synthase